MDTIFIFHADCTKDVSITARVANAGGDGVFVLTSIEPPAPDEQQPPDANHPVQDRATFVIPAARLQSAKFHLTQLALLVTPSVQGNANGIVMTKATQAGSAQPLGGSMRAPGQGLVPIVHDAQGETLAAASVPRGAAAWCPISIKCVGGNHA